MDLVGGIAPEDVENEGPEEKNQEDTSALEACPDLKIRLRMPSGRSVLFHCSLPSANEEATTSEQDSSNFRMRGSLTHLFSYLLCRYG